MTDYMLRSNLKNHMKIYLMKTFKFLKDRKVDLNKSQDELYSITTNSQLSTNEPKRKEKQQKQKLSKQPEQEQNQRNGPHMEGFQWRGGREE